jgi:hypothetical protein
VRSLRDWAWAGAVIYVASACGGRSVTIEEAPDAGAGGDGASGGVGATGGVGTGGRNVTGGVGGGGGTGGKGAAGGTGGKGGAGGGGGRGGKGGASGSGGKGVAGGFSGFGGTGVAGSSGVGGSAGNPNAGFGGFVGDPCVPNPCLNDGECVAQSEDSFSCECAPGYAGILCQAYVGLCAMSPCQNGGVCVDVPNDFECECPPPYFGRFCEQTGGACDDNPCKNGGTCTPVNDGFQCTCPAGLEQPTCETGTLTLPAYDRGWWDETGRHDADNDNTLTGYCACGTQLTNSYFSFLVPYFSGNLRAATLRLEIESYQSVDSLEAYAIYDVSTDAVTLESSSMGPLGIPVHEDLMSGSHYGSFAVAPPTVGSVVEAGLQGNAVANVSANRGQTFSVGVHLITYADTGNPEYVRFSGADEPRVHELVLELGN